MKPDSCPIDKIGWRLFAVWAYLHSKKTTCFDTSFFITEEGIVFDDAGIQLYNQIE